MKMAIMYHAQHENMVWIGRELGSGWPVKPYRICINEEEMAKRRELLATYLLLVIDRIIAQGHYHYPMMNGR